MTSGPVATMMLADQRADVIKIDDPRFRSINARAVNVTERITLTGDVLATETSAYWLAWLDAEDVPCAPILKREEVIDHPQIVANEIVAEYEHPIAGTTRQPRPAARFDKTPAMIRRPAPGLGEHNTEILAELGYSADEIKRLRDEEVLGA